MKITSVILISVISCQFSTQIKAYEQTPIATNILQSHTQVYAINYNSLVSKFIEKLIDNDCIVYFVDRESGIIDFRYQSEDNNTPDHRRVNILEGTILLQSVSAGATRVRAKLVLNWHDSYKSKGDFSDKKYNESGVQKDANAAYYKWLFDLFEK